ncbi:MAG: glycosyltransferase family 4 protein [Anaerolineales bacterium]
MRICCIAPSRIPSETANSIQAMKASHALAQLGHEVILIAPGSGPPGQTQQEKWRLLADQYGIETYFQQVYLPPFDGWLARRLFPWRAIWHAGRFKPDLIYTWLYQSAIGGLLQGRKVVLEMHGLPEGRFARMWYRLYLLLPGQKRQMVITRALKDRLERDFSLPQPETMIAPNGVALERYDQLPAPDEARRQLGLRQQPTVACTGSVYAGRGVELVLSLAGQMPDVHFLWVGGRPKEVASRRDEVQQLGLKNVTFSGFVPNADLPLYQAAADILLMPYQLDVGGSSGSAPVEFFSSMKMYEYMASRRPIISSDLPVIHEVLDEHSAVFCPPADPHVWESAIRRLLAHPDEAARLTEHAHQQVLPFSWTSRAEKVLQGWKI